MDIKKVKQLFEREIKRHTEEIAEHKRLAEIRGCKIQRLKATKHFHKLFQTKLLAKELSFEICEYCGKIKT